MSLNPSGGGFRLEAGRMAGMMQSLYRFRRSTFSLLSRLVGVGYLMSSLSTLKGERRCEVLEGQG
jgi:hypothetical protein